MFRDLRLRLRSLFRRNTVESELDRELRFHRDQQFASYTRAGLSPQDARRRLGIEFGGLEQTREAHRQARGIDMVEHLMQDVRFGVRSLLKSPGFTIIAALTLALGLGANTAMFSVVYGVLLRPLPYEDAASLIVLHETTPKVGSVSVAYPNFEDWRTQSRAFSSMAIVADSAANLGGVSQPENVEIEAVSSNFLSMLGARPVAGRDFSPAEDLAGAPPVVLLSHDLWQSHFGGSRDVIGQTITLDGQPVSIVGVLPAGFRSTTPLSLLEPIGMWLTDNDSATGRGNRGDTTVIGRLATGSTLEAARAEMDGIAARLAQTYPDTNGQFGVELQPIRDVLVGNVRPALLVLFGAVVCVLLIACANVANLCLIRGAGRTREIALRLAIGAGRGRIVSQLLVESALLALVGGVLGVALALGGIRGLAWLIPSASLGGATITLNGAVLAFASIAVFASTFIFGLAPAFGSARANVQSDLKEGGRSATAGRSQQRWRAVLAVAEVALALVLVVGAGLMLRSLSHLLSVDSGIQPDRVLTVQVGLRGPRYSSGGPVRQFWTDLIDGTRRLPGVAIAALGTGVPFANQHSRRDITLEGVDLPTGGLPHPDMHIVSPGYVPALGIRVLAGRDFTETDTDKAPRVGLINRAIADKFFNGTNPIGRRFGFGRPGSVQAWITIVGVVDDTRMYGLDNPSRLEAYVPFSQSNRAEAMLIVKSTGDAAALVPGIRSLVASIDRDQPLTDINTMEELIDLSVSTRQVTFVLMTLFSALALALAAIGIYGVMSYSVAQRTNELGIRLALGAPRMDLLQSIVRQGFTLAAIGIAIGVVASLALTRVMSSLLFAVNAADPITFVAVGAGVALVALVACTIPGLRALRLNPLVALRRD
jgi:predicted permease